MAKPYEPSIANLKYFRFGEDAYPQLRLPAAFFEDIEAAKVAPYFGPSRWGNLLLRLVTDLYPELPNSNKNVVTNKFRDRLLWLSVEFEPTNKEDISYYGELQVEPDHLQLTGESTPYSFEHQMGWRRDKDGQWLPEHVRALDPELFPLEESAIDLPLAVDPRHYGREVAYAAYEADPALRFAFYFSELEREVSSALMLGTLAAQPILNT